MYSNNLNEKPLVGFFPVFWSLGETLPLVKLAESYMKSGGKAIFFSHAKPFEYMAEDIGCEVVRLGYIWTDFIDKLKKIKAKGISAEKLTFTPYIYKKGFIDKLVKEEIEAFKKTGIKSVVSAFNITCSISARFLKIPLIVLISGTSVPPYLKSNFITYPDNFENIFTKMIPKSIKNQIARWYLLNNKWLVRKFNKIARKYKIKRFKCFNDIILGDYTLVCDDINFLGLKPTKEFPIENYIGPIFNKSFFKEENKEYDTDILNHLKKPGRSILLTLGSLAPKPMYLKILNALNKTNYNVVTSFGTLLKEEDVSRFNNNILLKKYIPSIKKVHENFDLAIIHGGRGTVYNVAYSAKPAIGIPIFLEQQFNLDTLVRHGSGIRISNKHYNETKLLDAINSIFTNYDEFLINAQNLAAKLTQEPGEKKAAQRIFEITQLKYGK